MLTKYEAALMLEQIIDEDTGLAPEAVAALMMGIDALVEADKSQWIPCNERMPEEADSMFAKFYGTDKWRSGMMRKRSDKVIVTYEYPDGGRLAGVSRTNDGKWQNTLYLPQEVIAWMPFPAPYQPEEHTGCTSDACPIEGVEQDG